MLQSINGHLGHFTHIFAGREGSTQDGRIFCNSSSLQMKENECYAPGATSIEFGSLFVLPFIPLDLAYPFFPYLIKPYTGTWIIGKNTLTTT